MKKETYDFGQLGTFSKTTLLELKNRERCNYGHGLVSYRVEHIEQIYRGKIKNLKEEKKNIENINVDRGLFSTKLTMKDIKKHIDKLNFLEKEINTLIKDYDKYRLIMRQLAQPENNKTRKRQYELRKLNRKLYY